MRRLVFVAPFVFVWFAAQAAMAQSPALKPNPQIEVAYKRPPLDVDHPARYLKFMSIYDRLLIRRPLDELQKFLAPLRLPHKIKIETDQCNAERRPYIPGGPVTICYEMIDKIESTAANFQNPAQRQSVIVGTFTVAVLHELAYAVFDVLQVPVWGREDDAADRLAAFVLMQFSEKVAQTTMVGAAEFFLASHRTWTGSAFAVATSPAAQRFYNILCIAYGGDHQDFGGWAQSHNGRDPLIPARRARQCHYEYEQVRHAFDLRIMPHIDADALVAVKASEWFLPGELPK